MDGIQPVIAAGSRELFAPIIEPARLVGGTESAQGSSFVHSLADAIRSTDDQERVADEKMAAVDSGSSDVTWWGQCWPARMRTCHFRCSCRCATRSRGRWTNC